MLVTTNGLKNTHLLFPPEMVQHWFSSHVEIPTQCSPEPYPADSDAACSQLLQVMWMQMAHHPGPGDLAQAHARALSVGQHSSRRQLSVAHDGQ